MMTRIRFDETMTDAPQSVLAVEIELPAGFASLPVTEQHQLVEDAMARANETTQRILDRRRAGVAA